MSKILRKVMKVFGSAADTNQISQFGSLAAGSIAYTTDPTVIQSLANYLTGWFGGVVGSNSPAIQDMNALCYLFAYQLAYLCQTGAAEWDATTTYYKGSLANNGGGLTYASITDTNLNNAVTDTTNWRLLNGPVWDVIIGSAPYCTHATLAAAVADSAVGTNARVLITASTTVAAVALTKAGWRIEGLPGVTLSKNATTTGLSCQAAGIEIGRLRFSGWSTAGDKAITGTSAWQYGRVMLCNFNACDTNVDTSNSPAGKIAITLGNITE